MTYLAERLVELRRHLDMRRVVEALDRLDPIERFVDLVRGIVSPEEP